MREIRKEIDQELEWIERSLDTTKDGYDLFDYENALAILLMNEAVFVSPRSGLYINCSDFFGLACADSENIKFSDIKEIFSFYLKDESGPLLWAALKRKEKPLDNYIKKFENIFPIETDILKGY
jgi:hypothetical protein